MITLVVHSEMRLKSDYPTNSYLFGAYHELVTVQEKQR